MTPLASYVFAAMVTWSPIEKQPNVKTDGLAEESDRYATIAEDIAYASNGLYRDATILASIAFWESRYWRFVDDGSCNGERYFIRVKCDARFAASIWQIHTGKHGIVLTPNGGMLYGEDARALGLRAYFQADIRGEENRRTAAIVAMAMVRNSLKMTKGLCGYTGETGPCPKADERLNLATAYISKHPFHGAP